MKDIIIKSFIVPKDIDSDVCQDSLAINLKRGRFVVADGVTNSNHPEIFSRLLCEAFVLEEITIQDWPTEFEEKVLQKASEKWKETEETLFSSLTGRKRIHAQMRRDYYSPGASTFAGIEIDKDNKVVQYQIIGDSTLFFIGSDETYFAVNSCSSCNEKGLIIPFDNTPGTIVADGKVYGKWVSGSYNLQEGYIALMTDGCANWFQEAYARDPSIIEKLWELHDNVEFTTFVANVWAQQPKYEDDWALILIKLEKEVYEMTSFPDNQPQALFVGYEEPSLEITQENVDDEVEEIAHEVEKNEEIKNEKPEEGDNIEDITDDKTQETVLERAQEELLNAENNEDVNIIVSEVEYEEVDQPSIEDDNETSTEGDSNDTTNESALPHEESDRLEENEIKSDDGETSEFDNNVII